MDISELRARAREDMLEEMFSPLTINLARKYQAGLIYEDRLTEEQKEELKKYFQYRIKVLREDNEKKERTIEYLKGQLRLAMEKKK